MSCMTAKSFVDTNVVLYTIGKDARKADIARELVGAQPAISTQVVNESISFCLRKLSFTREKAYAFGRTLMDQTEVLPLDEATLDRAASAISFHIGTRSSSHQRCLPAVTPSTARTCSTAKSLMNS